VSTETQERLIAHLSETIQRLDFARRHGIQYEGARDLYAVGGHKRTLSYGDYIERSERNGTAGQVIDLAPETTWRNPPEVSEPEQDGEDATEFVTQWNDLIDRLGVWGVFEDAHRLSRIGRYSVVLIGAAGGDDFTLRNPLNTVRGPEDILYLSAFSEKNATIATWVTDSTDSRFGEPLMYSIDIRSDIASIPNAGTREVHWSRVIHVSDGKVYGRPVLGRIWNDLDNLEKVSTCTAEAFWQLVGGILHAKLPTGADVIPPTPEELGELDAKLKELQHDLARTVYTNADLARLAEGAPDPKAAAELYMTLIAAGASPPIPKRILFGSETGERASEQDLKNWLGSIASLQMHFGEPRMLRPLIDRLILFRALPRPTTGKYEVVWPTLYSVPEKEVAEANKLRADAIKALVPVGGDPMAITEVDEERNIWIVPRNPDEASPFEEALERQREIDEASAEPPAMEEAA
jgi:hypothetical protein